MIMVWLGHFIGRINKNSITDGTQVDPYTMGEDILTMGGVRFHNITSFMSL